MENQVTSIWIFNGSKGRFPSGVFTDREMAEEWIRRHKLTGMLTLYPINEGVYDWAIKNGLFKPTKEKEQTEDFIGSFSSAGQEHFHYLEGELD
jgi:hypothetical protein